MGATENKANVRKLVLEGVNKGNMALIDECLSPDVIEHSLPPGLPPNRDGFKMFVTNFRAAFPDLIYTIDDEMAEGDKVAQRLIGTATMKGDFQGMKASGKKATWQEMHFGRFNASGKVVEHWAVVDMASMLAQLGFGPGGD